MTAAKAKRKRADHGDPERLLTGTVEHCSGEAGPGCAVMDLIEESMAAEAAHVSH